jgi:hypothetical protein
MDYSSKTRQELIALCKEAGLKKYSSKKKDELIVLLEAHAKEQKKNRGQFYTVNNEYILNGLDDIFEEATDCHIIEPFVGQGDLITWITEKVANPTIESYDIDPKMPTAIKQDTLENPPIYANKWIITNPPYLARNKCESKTMFDKYDTNDLYKCFIHSLTNQKHRAAGGIFIIPVGFFLSPRDIDVRCRNAFLSKYEIVRVNYFEEDVFPDTSTTVVAFSFRKGNSTNMTSQSIPWYKYPSNESQTFTLSASADWIISGDIYQLGNNATVSIRRYVENETELRDGEQLSNLTLTALDSGKMDGRISLNYKKDYIYPAKNTSRSYATFIIKGLGRNLTEEEQLDIAEKFNTFIEDKRKETWSLFLPQFRESKEYARKRIPFELAYSITAHFISSL